MTPRFVLDEWSWAEAAKADLDVLSDAIHRLIDRLDVARDRSEVVVKHEYFYEMDLGEGLQLFSVLFEFDHHLQFDRDLKLRLELALEQTSSFDDSKLADYDAEFCGTLRFAPGVVWAHSCCSNRHQVAVLPLDLEGVPSGKVPVVVAGDTREIAFVTDDLQHCNFFRSIIELENADAAMFERLAPSAFPALKWADYVWGGLHDFSCPYVNIRGRLVRCLSGLNDHGAACFHEHRAGDPRNLAEILSARIGAETSDENGHTKNHAPSKRDRIRCHLGKEKVFWWHSKLFPHIDRIHFLYEPQVTDAPQSKPGHIVVGIFKDHCILP